MIYNPFSAHANPNYDPSKPASPSNPKILRDPFSGDTIPAGLMSPVALEVLDAIPLPNLMPGDSLAGMNMAGTSGGGADSNNYLDLRTGYNSSDQGTFRVDRNFARGDAVYARYSIGHKFDFTPQNLPGFGAFDDNLAQNLTVSYTHLMAPVSVNTLYLGLSRLSMHRYSENNFTHDYVSQLGIQGVGFGGKGAWGRVGVAGRTSLGDFGAPVVRGFGGAAGLGDGGWTPGAFGRIGDPVRFVAAPGASPGFGLGGTGLAGRFGFSGLALNGTCADGTPSGVDGASPDASRESASARSSLFGSGIRKAGSA